jgi:hypothetical protein
MLVLLFLSLPYQDAMHRLFFKKNVQLKLNLILDQFLDGTIHVGLADLGFTVRNQKELTTRVH